MPLYMTQFAYTSDAWAALVKNPQNREDVLRALIEKLGGRLVSFYYAFGEYDGMFVSEMPDETTVTAAILAAVGLAAALLPAHRAARLEPSQVLRHE